MITSIVAGGAGFLGSHLVDALVKRGESVVVLDNLTTGRLANLENAISSGSVTFVYADVATNGGTLRTILSGSGVKKVDRVYHLASPAGSNVDDGLLPQTLSFNGLGTLSLIEVALEHRARFIYSSTSESYDDTLLRSEPGHYAGDGDPIGTASSDGEYKRLGEAAVAAAVNARGLDARVVRFFDCYGPRMKTADGRLIPVLFEAAAARRPFPIAGTGEQTHSMTYIDDAIRLLLIVAAMPQSSLQPVNIGTDEERSVIEIARALAAVLRVDFVPEFVAARPGDRQRLLPDLKRTRILGWNPSTSLEDGLRKSYEWFSRESHLCI